MATGGSPLNIVDRVVGFFSPRRAGARLIARRQLKVLMNYDAASRGRRTYGWRAPASGADAAGHEGGARTQLRNLSRDFVRNRPFAARGLSVITGNVVGSGIAASIDASNEKIKAEAERVVLGHLNSPDLDAQRQHNLVSAQRVVMNGVVEDGEVLVRRRWRSGRYARGLLLPFQIELLEADYLNPWITSNGQNEVIDGVEFGPTGRIEAYHLFRQHPGTITRRLNLDSVRVPAADIIHVRRMDRPGQMRGISWFAPVMMTLGDLSDYQEAEILKQKIAALLAGFLESDDVDATLSASTTDDDAAALGLGEIAPGTLTELPAGKRIKFTDPPEVRGYDGFMRQNLAAVAMGLGITYESLAGDLTRVNFSSGRMGRMEMDRNVETWQQQVMIDQLCTGLARWSIEAWTVAYMAPAAFALTWTAPRRPVIDPTKEIPAIIKEIDAGLTSRQRAQRQLGRDPDTIHKERLEDEVKAAEFTASNQTV